MHVALDIEIQNEVDEVNINWRDTDKMGVSVAVTYDFDSDTYKLWDDRQVDNLRLYLEYADRITGWNTWRFDLPVIWGYRWPVTELSCKNDDMLQRVLMSKGLNPNLEKSYHGWGLDAVCKSTINLRKTGNGGKMAPQLWREGRLGELVSYCLNDVAMTQKLCRHLEQYGYLLTSGGVRTNIIPYGEFMERFQRTLP